MMLCLFIFSGDLPCRFGFIIQVLFHIHFSLGEFWITGRSSQTEYSILLWNKCTHCRTPSEGMYFLWPTEQCLSLDSKLVVSPCHWKTRTFGMLRWHLHANTLQIGFFFNSFALMCVECRQFEEEQHHAEFVWGRMAVYGTARTGLRLCWAHKFPFHFGCIALVQGTLSFGCSTFKAQVKRVGACPRRISAHSARNITEWANCFSQLD